jgi:hypothetical protein
LSACQINFNIKESEHNNEEEGKFKEGVKSKSLRSLKFFEKEMPHLRLPLMNKIENLIEEDASEWGDLKFS